MNELFLGFYFGIISTVLLYNLHWYVNSKERAYLYYVFMHLSLIFLFLHAYGIFETNRITLGALVIVFSIHFMRSFLNLHIYYPRLNQFLLYFTLVYLITFIIFDFIQYDAVVGNIPYSLLFVPFIYLAFKVYKKGLKSAKYFLIGWGIFVVNLLIFDYLKFFGNSAPTHAYLIQIGNLFEALVLSFVLSHKTHMLMHEKNEQEKMLIHQSRLASMGEMLANISHQWRQPLNRIATFIMNMQLHIYDQKEQNKYLLEKLEASQEQLEYMSHTIDDFSNFYQKDRAKEKFKITRVINKAHNIIKSTLESKKINCVIDIEDDFKLYSYPKELAQVVLNLMQNAKEQFSVNNTSKPCISVKTKDNKLTIKDNAGGIDEEIINRIFEPYFTTKEKHEGSGLGLYMSRKILEKDFDAIIHVSNHMDGAQFTITFPKIK